jgi:hypothetical protein
LDAPVKTVSAETPPDGEAAMSDLEQLSRDEIEALLAEELKSIDDLLKGN